MADAKPIETTADLIRALGGPSRVAVRLGCTTSAVSQWRAAGIPREHYLAVWDMALAAGLNWAPPGADALREKLLAQCPATAAADAANA